MRDGSPQTSSTGLDQFEILQSLQILGQVFEILGACLMANAYLVVRGFWGKLWLLLRLLPPGSSAWATIDLLQHKGFTKEQVHLTARGLSFIALGFLLQAISTLTLLIQHYIERQ